MDKNCPMAGFSMIEGDASPTIQSLPEGFKVVATKAGPDFHCMTFVPVEP
jgi:hypothetical protein